MLILAFDTSSKTVAVALLRNNDILYDTIINTALNHSEVLLPAIDQACRQTQITINDIDLFASTLGPGSFTGLRIGISTLKGLMLATGKPAAGVSSLAALALNVNEIKKTICSVMDAGRGQVYVAYYRYNKNGILDQIGTEKVVNPREIMRDFDQDMVIVGDGAIKYADIICKAKVKKILIASALQQYIRASAVGVLAIEKFTNNDLLDETTLVPIYLRSADALPQKPLFRES